MTATLRIDTLKFLRKLTEAGMERGMAEAIVEGLAEADTSDLATKGDVAMLKGDLALLRADLMAELTGVEGKLRAEIADVKFDLARLMLVQTVTIVGLTVALMKLLP